MIRIFFVFIRTKLEVFVKKLVVGVKKKRIKMNNSESIDLENINLEGNIEVPTKKAEVTQQTKAAFG